MEPSVEVFEDAAVDIYGAGVKGIVYVCVRRTRAVLAAVELTTPRNNGLSYNQLCVLGRERPSPNHVCASLTPAEAGTSARLGVC